jgi:hypothetical protein
MRWEPKKGSEKPTDGHLRSRVLTASAMENVNSFKLNRTFKVIFK